MKKKLVLTKIVLALALLFNPVTLGVQANDVYDDELATYNNAYEDATEIDAQASEDSADFQVAIGAMRTFIETNSVENPFVVPAGLTFFEAINALDWGVGVTVNPAMSGLGQGSVAGAIILYLNANEDGTFDADYFFPDVVLYYHFETSAATDPTLSQTTIDAMYAFIAKNSSENPFVIPAGLTFNEALNALNWGEGVTVLAIMSGLEAPQNTVWGSIFLRLNEQTNEDGTHSYDDEYGFLEIGLFYHFEETPTEEVPNNPTLSQTAIDAMYAFIANNSAENPFVIPAGLTFFEAINAFNWGEGITVMPILSGLEMPQGTAGGAIILYLNAQISEAGVHAYEDDYFFADVVLHYYFEEAQATEPSTVAPTTPPTLPQTSTAVVNVALAGGALLAGGVSIATKKRKG